MIKSGDNMIKTSAIIYDELKEYGNPATKLGRMVKEGKYIPIIKGMYETKADVNGYLLAGSIYGPSYLSFDFALAYYGLIPEAVYVYTSATFEKKKKKIFSTPFGCFTYTDIPSQAFPFFIELKKEGEYFFQIASPEKALCDKLYISPTAVNQKDLKELLFDDLRIDEDEFKKLDRTVIDILSSKYPSTNLKLLAKLIKRY